MSWKATWSGLLVSGTANMSTIAGSTTVEMSVSQGDAATMGRLRETLILRIPTYPVGGNLGGAEAFLLRTSVTWTADSVVRNELNDEPVVAMAPVSDGDDSDGGCTVKIPVCPEDETGITVSWPAGLASATDCDFDCVPACRRHRHRPVDDSRTFVRRKRPGHIASVCPCNIQS